MMKRRVLKRHGPDPIDVYVGSRVRLRRTLLGLSQEKVAKALGLTFQQQTKYEHGSNRISASKLYRLGEILDVPVSFFFDGLGEPSNGAEGGGIDELLRSREMLELARAYYRIPDAAVRKRVGELARFMGAPR